ncbi:MAG: fused MFS/spermidine synthase [Planctomycetota bacterium]|nr:fused MFS/spermidine synthase [Planctomycetota bacterium]MCX8038967.1 fused MFS/spermidine synthase [Planctomycetota bacterium]MDW8372782.1 fused MFS/spermidine synthase [Planctomycetota bacterium]
MTRRALSAALIALLAAGAGLVWQDHHYRLDQPGLPSDQRVLAHRDSPYTGMTWVASESNNYLQLRFFEMVEGGICLRPAWHELAALPSLAHLRPAEDGVALAGPGSLNNSPYISLFPAGLLLNRQVPEAPRILIVGLGSGIGIAHLAHHFPRAEIEVVDIDPAVIAIVREHYPLLAWLERTGRLRLVARDARAHIRARRGHGFHLIVLDAYTAGSTIPPHLMTREFFAECAAALAEGGTVLANVIGSLGERVGEQWRGPKRRVVGGALRSLRAAGLTDGWVFPIVHAYENPAGIDRSLPRNHIVIVARHPLAPRRFEEGWQRLRAWQPYPELASGRYLSRQYQLLDREGRAVSTLVPASWIEERVPRLAGLGNRPLPEGAPAHTQSALTDDRALVAEAIAAVLAAAPAGSHLRGWRSPPPDAQLLRRSIDWTLFPRETWRATLAAARDAARYDPDLLVGPPDGPEREAAPRSWHIVDAPLFTDQTPNADIMNH